MRLPLGTTFSLAVLGVVALALLNGILALHASYDRIAWARWLVYASMALAAGLGALAVCLFFLGAAAPLGRTAAERPPRLDRSRSQLFELERLALVGKLAASMAHEIRSPLTAMKMWLFAIRTAAGQDAELHRRFDIVSGEMARLESIVGNVLEFSRPPVPTLRPQSVSAVIDKTFDLACHQIRQKRIRLSCDKPPMLPPVLADPQQLEQVFLNLLNNAVEATPEGGEIRFRAALEGDRGNGRRVVVRVQDTGPGIAESARSRIFEPFYTTKENGTGLGLYIAAQIMTRLGGRLVLEWPTPGGTSFAVWVPTAESEDHEQDPGRG